MSPRPSRPYGTPNWELVGRWLHLAPDDDGPFWALNLMRYRAVAQYADGTSGVTGREADDAYAPLGPLAAVGAMVAFHGDVTDQPLGEPGWDRVGIVRYPTRAAFLAMQEREDFQTQHVHKEAGMEFTIVMSCLPVAHQADDPGAGALVAVVERGASAASLPPGCVELVGFDVEGVILGDDRTFDRARFLRVPAGALPELVGALGAAEEAHLLVLDPSIDALVESVGAAPSAGR